MRQPRLEAAQQDPQADAGQCQRDSQQAPSEERPQQAEPGAGQQAFRHQQAGDREQRQGDQRHAQDLDAVYVQELEGGFEPGGARANWSRPAAGATVGRIGSG